MFGMLHTEQDSLVDPLAQFKILGCHRSTK